MGITVVGVFVGFVVGLLVVIGLLVGGLETAIVICNRRQNKTRALGNLFTSLE